MYTTNSSSIKRSLQNCEQYCISCHNSTETDEITVLKAYFSKQFSTCSAIKMFTVSQQKYLHFIYTFISLFTYCYSVPTQMKNNISRYIWIDPEIYQSINQSINRSHQFMMPGQPILLPSRQLHLDCQFQKSRVPDATSKKQTKQFHTMLVR